MQKIVLGVISAVLLVGVGALLFAQPKKAAVGPAGSTQNVEVRDGVQYVRVRALAGYSPQVSNAKAGLPTKLVVSTDGTYDCSSALVIRSVGFEKILAPTGEEVIDLGTPEAGKKVQGLCSMGMYSFAVNFK